MAVINPFTVVVPVVIDDSNLTSTTATDATQVYNAGSTYALEERVQYQNFIYESLQAANTGNTPDVSPTWWIQVSATNDRKMFDESGNTATTGTSPMEWVITGDMIDTISLLEVTAAKEVRIQAYAPSEGTYFDETFEFPDSAILSSWYDYFFSPIQKASSIVVSNIIPISGSTYTMTLSSEGDIEDVGVGTFVAGSKIEFGFTKYNASVGITDYSRKSTDQFGNVTLTQRKFAKKMDVQIVMPAGLTDTVYSKLAALRSSVVLWVAAKDTYESLTIYGYYQDFNIDIAYPDMVYCSLDIEGIA